MNSKTSYDIKTFGCKVNTYDTGLLQKRLAAAGFMSDNQAGPPVHILNTCAVTAEATREAVKSVRKLKSKNPECTVVVTGCAAQVDTDQFSGLEGVDLVVANSHKGDLENIIARYLRGESDQRVFKSNIFKKLELESGGGVELQHTRTFLKIQDGCNSFCTFCVIPFARGKSRSIPRAELIDRVNELYADGVREVVITGVHIGDYEDESLPESQRRLEGLVEQLLVKTQMPRFRISSLEPIEVSERLLDCYQQDRLCPHFHMSIQSAQSKVLRDMKRQYGHESVEQSLRRIYDRVQGVFVGMDVIAGFPGESESEFLETYNRLSDLPWTRAHVFPYSQRPGTFAARMPNPGPQHLIHQRAARLRELSSDRYAQTAMNQVGQVKQVLLLNKPSKGAQGLSRDYWPVAFEAGNTPAGREISVKIKGYDHSHGSRMDGCLVGEAFSAV